jgi:hypothetical protein
MRLAARLFVVLLFILAVIGLWRLPRSDGPAGPPIKFAVTAECLKKIAPLSVRPLLFAVNGSLKSAAAECVTPDRHLPQHSSAQLANIPASIPVAATTRSGPRGYHHAWHCHHHTWRYRHAWPYSAAVVRAAVVAVATAAAIRAGVKARSATTSDRNCQTGLSLFERCERHGLGGGNAEETDADDRCEGKKFSHSFLLGVYSKQHRFLKSRTGNAML